MQSQHQPNAAPDNRSIVEPEAKYVNTIQGEGLWTCRLTTTSRRAGRSGGGRPGQRSWRGPMRRTHEVGSCRAGTPLRSSNTRNQEINPRTKIRRTRGPAAKTYKGQLAFIFSLTLWASFSISSAFRTTSRERVFSLALSTYCFNSVASLSKLSVSRCS